MPVGDRWRAQGYIDGKHQYLGTFDTEEDAHRVFTRAKEDAEEGRRMEVEAEVERILAGPTFVYEGGVGRGAPLNGKRFKMVEIKEPHSAIVVPLLSDGTLGWDAQRTILRAYLHEVGQETLPLPEPPKTAAATSSAALTVEQGSRVAVKADLVKFVGRPVHQDLPWAVDFVARHGRAEARTVSRVLSGVGGIQQQLEWLRANTTLPADLVDEVERETLGDLFETKESKAAARVLAREYPECDSSGADSLKDEIDLGDRG
jgi:hypothetical protein